MVTAAHPPAYASTATVTVARSTSIQDHALIAASKRVSLLAQRNLGLAHSISRDNIRTQPLTALLTAKIEGPRLLLLAGHSSGHSWRVTWIDWKRRRCFVEPADGGGKARWIFPGIGGASFALSRAGRDVLLGIDPPVWVTRRAQTALTKAREVAPDVVHPGGTVILRRPDGDVRWWTWAGWRANATLIATLGDVADAKQRVEEFFVRLRTDATTQMWKDAMTDIEERLCLPTVDRKALDGLKFSVALPRHLAAATLAARLADLDGARIALAEPHRFLTL